MKLGDMSGFRGIFLGLLIAGLALIAYGGSTDKPFLTAIGGALFGNSVASFVGRYSNQAFEERVRSLVEEGVTDSFVSNEEMLVSSRIEWHLYHVTEIGGEVVWRHAILDFTKSHTPGRLTSRSYFLDENGEPQPYDVEAGRRDERFVIFLRPPMSEEAAVTYIFPYMGFSAFSLHFGVCFVETWDGTRAITSAILARKAIHDHEGKLLSRESLHDHGVNQPIKSFGTLDDEASQALDRLWRREIQRLASFFPETGATTKSASLG